MSTRNFDSRVIIQQLQNKNTAKNIYTANGRGEAILRNPQTSNGNASVIERFQEGAMSTYQKGLLGGVSTVETGGTCVQP